MVSVSELTVTDVWFPNVDTDQFNVTWTPASGTADFVSSYSVGYYPVGVSSEGLYKTETGNWAVVKALTPGLAYYVKVISINYDTEVDYTRTTFVATEQATGK